MNPNEQAWFDPASCLAANWQQQTVAGMVGRTRLGMDRLEVYIEAGGTFTAEGWCVLRVILYLGLTIMLSVLGVTLLRLPPPAAKQPMPFLGYCCAYYGGFLALIAAGFVLWIRLRPALLKFGQTRDHKRDK